MSQRQLTVGVFALLLLADVIQFVLMLSMKQLSPIFSTLDLAVLGSPTRLITIGEQLVASPYLWLSGAMMVSSFVVWMSVLAKLDLSVAFPLGSISFIVIPLLSMVFLHESIPPLRWLGFALVVVGIVTLSWGENKPEPQA